MVSADLCIHDLNPADCSFCSGRGEQVPRCFDCMTKDVAVKAVDPSGIEHWFCAADWQVREDFKKGLDAFLENARRNLPAEGECPQ